MNKFFRRQFWLISAFFRRYYQVILVTVIISVILGFGVTKLAGRLGGLKTTRVALIGQYTSQTLPPLVKNILNSGLTMIGPNQTIVPNLTEKWEVKDEGKTYVFTLKPGLTWSDGTPVKASDIVINIPDVNISFENDNTIVFSLPQPFSPFPSVLTNPITNKEGLTASNYEVTLSQNTNGVLTKVVLKTKNEQLIIRLFPSASQALTAYKLGEVDAIYNYPVVDSHNLADHGKIREVDNFRQSLVLFMNNQDPTLRDKSIRQGIAYAIKEKAFGGQRALGPISRDSWAYNPLVKSYDYDPDHASRLIKSVLPDKNQVVNLELATIPQYLPIAEKIKSGLDPNLLNLNIKVVTSRPESYQLYLTLFEISPDPDQYVFWHSHGTNNISKVNNERLDKDLEDGRRELDSVERKKIYTDFQRTFSEELPALFLFYPKYVDLARREAIFDIITPEIAL